MENEFYNNYKLRESFISENGKNYLKVLNHKVEINEDLSNDIEDWMKENHKKHYTKVLKKYKKQIINELNKLDISFKNNSDYYEFCLDNFDLEHLSGGNKKIRFNDKIILEYNEK